MRNRLASICSNVQDAIRASDRTDLLHHVGLCLKMLEEEPDDLDHAGDEEHKTEQTQRHEPPVIFQLLWSNSTAT